MIAINVFLPPAGIPQAIDTIDRKHPVISLWCCLT